MWHIFDVRQELLPQLQLSQESPRNRQAIFSLVVIRMKEKLQVNSFSINHTSWGWVGQHIIAIVLSSEAYGPNSQFSTKSILWTVTVTKETVWLEGRCYSFICNNPWILTHLRSGILANGLELWDEYWTGEMHAANYCRIAKKWMEEMWWGKMVSVTHRRSDDRTAEWLVADKHHRGGLQ